MGRPFKDHPNSSYYSEAKRGTVFARRCTKGGLGSAWAHLSCACEALYEPQGLQMNCRAGLVYQETGSRATSLAPPLLRKQRCSGVSISFTAPRPVLVMAETQIKMMHVINIKTDQLAYYCLESQQYKAPGADRPGLVIAENQVKTSSRC